MIKKKLIHADSMRSIVDLKQKAREKKKHTHKHPNTQNNEQKKHEKSDAL